MVVQARKLAAHLKKQDTDPSAADAGGARFVWQKKIEKDLGEGADVHDFSKKAQRRKQQEREVGTLRPPEPRACGNPMHQTTQCTRHLWAWWLQAHLTDLLDWLLTHVKQPASSRVPTGGERWHCSLQRQACTTRTELAVALWQRDGALAGIDAIHWKATSFDQHRTPDHSIMLHPQEEIAKVQRRREEREREKEQQEEVRGLVPHINGLAIISFPCEANLVEHVESLVRARFRE